MGRGSRDGVWRDRKRKMYYIHVLTPHKECKNYVLKAYTNLQKKNHCINNFTDKNSLKIFSLPAAFATY